ncbi:MSHA biogenesis protein MshB [Thalassotalea loyana]|uniref:MSHA biogenesis protein MshB n=1 Tax=Thalassotalea loyana TaxID=280483 RepID=A0ABQ6H7W2_9GAMM|nr:type II secretion system protein [Thalassotalea loyana]GLX84218.1 MSHA biogenesis protein MshB [Thalassotalea loyana]
MRKHSGFTLIELVVVVVILGFLAVTAIPKFIDLTDQAKQANIEGMAGGFATGVSLVRAQWEAEGRPQNSSGQNSVNYDGVELVLTTEDEATGVRPGYVTGLTDGAALGGGFDSANCEEIWLNILQQPPRITNDLATLNSDESIDYFVSENGDVQNSTCHYYLKESLNRDGNGDWENPNNSTSIGNSFTYSPANSAVVIHINQQ